VGFSVRIGQKKTVDNVVVWRRFLCGKAGIRTNKEEERQKEIDGKKIRTHARRTTPRSECANSFFNHFIG
jgi:hypothetical protein